ncbi:MAG: LytTR family DNA-binding domain-containing protein [Bacteroidota bacterium]
MKIKILIIEDERLAANQLKRILNSLHIDIEVVAVIESKKEAIQKIPSLDLDLIFMDIHLTDGKSFDIFSAIEITTPVIFTTAYDEYSLQAFKHFSIDYLLKPIDPKELKNAVDKFIHYFNPNQQEAQLQQLINHIKAEPSFKNRFLIKVGSRLKSIESKEIAYFYAQDKATYLCTSEGRNFPIDLSLKELESSLDPSLFFRVNRKHIISRPSIEDLVYLSPTRLMVSLRPMADEDVIVAGDRVSTFKGWLS